ncbi:MAG: helix-turn-helix transcriptional regulator [Alistipes sp.]|nr:helix-turn-helix transcriptional regulator [Alistipes sp.]
MLDERLFYFIHGAVTLYFLKAGLYRIRRKEASRLERLCGYVLLYWGFLEVKDLLFYAAPIFRENYLSNLLILIDMTAVPAGCYFIIELLNTGWYTLRRALWLASPFLFAVLCYAVTGTAWIVDATFIFVWCYAVGFIIYMVYAVRRYNRLLAENYSNVERVHVRWLSGVAAMLAICLAVWTISSYYSSWVSDSLYQLTLLTMWVVALYYADRQQAPEIAPLPNVPKAHADSVLGDVLEQKLQRLMTEERLWVNPHLTLSDLAMQVGTNRTYLSNYLNNSLQTTFYDYVNDYRLQAALQHLHDVDSTATMAEIAEQCGFNSLSTFRRVFVRAKGCSFNEYRAQIERSQSSK